MCINKKESSAITADSPINFENKIKLAHVALSAT